MLEDFCIISSNCISGFWYRDIVKSEYEVPFIWSIIRLSDMLILIRNFEEINFKNIVSKISEGEIKRKDGDKWVKIVVDNKINTYFVHYREDKNLKDGIKINGVNVVSGDILKYATDTWIRRSSRVPYNKKMVWVFWDDKINTNVDLSEFINVSKEKPNDIFVLFSPNIPEHTQQNLIVLPITNYNDVPKHVRDLQIALEKYEKTSIV